ncbi:MAG: radical SAM protein [Saprospiraceae bacterium]|nr:radical SAM protein [Saprospiraceae bacterium]
MLRLNRDTFNFISKLSIPKLVNASKLLFSYYLSKWTGRAKQWGTPMTLSIEPTTACNLKCPECPSGLRQFTRATGNLKEDFFRRTIDQVSSKLLYLIFYFQGEPYINPKFLDMVAYANTKNIYTISSTNGHFLDDNNCRKTIEAGLDRLIISLDGLTQSSYENYRIGGELATVIEGTKRLIKWKKKLNSHKPYIIFQFLAVRPNEHEIPEVQNLADELGVDEVKIKTAQIYNYKQGSPLIPLNQKYSRYIQNASGEYELKSKTNDSCWKMWHAAVITWDGLVVPCCFDKDAEHRMGNLNQNSFEDVWNSTTYQSFRQKILEGRKNINICSNCSEGCKVWA